MNKKSYYVYIVECSDGTLYTGYTTNVERRVNEHNSSKRAAKYTRARRPVHLLHTEIFTTVSAALKREYAIKKMSRKEKKKLVNKHV